jgi:hypothetical protein
MFSNNPIRRFFDPNTTGGAASAQDIQNQQKLNSELNKTNEVLSETEEIVLDVKNAFRGIAAEIVEIADKKLKTAKSEFKNVGLGIKKDIVSALKEQGKETGRILDLQKKQLNGSIKTADVEKRISAAKDKQRNIVYALEEAAREGVITEKTKLDKISAANKQYDKQKAILDEINKKAEQFEKKLGITYKIFDGINKIPILNSLIKIDKVKSAMEEAAAAGKSTWGVFGTGVKETFSQIGKSLMDPLVIVTSIAGLFTMLIKTVLEVDKYLTDFAKNIGMSKNATNILAKNFDNMSYNVGQYSKNLTAGTFSIKAQMHATNELNDALGTAELFTGEMVAGQVLLTKRLGLSNEEAAEFAKFSLLSGKSQENISTEIGDQIVAFKKETGVQLNMKKVMQDVTKIHGQLSANLGNDPKKIAAAVMQAQKLGITLEQSRKISESLLDFESSIENELEAELLTGKRLNLEKARALALQGKTADAAKELLDQVGGLSEFQSLNIIQQNALAKAVGMTADEMADAFKQQELLRGTAFATKEAFLEQRKIAEQNGTLAEFEANVRQAANGEQLLAMGAQQSAQEKFQEAVDKLKETFARIASGPMLHMIEQFANFISKAENLKGIISTIQNIINTIATIIGGKMVIGLIAASAQFAIQAVAAGVTAAGAIATASAITLGIGAIAVAAGIITMMGALNEGIEQTKAAVDVKDAAISPSGGLLISGPKGSFITDPADQVVAAPNAANMIGGGGISKADIDAIANRPISINIQANTDTLLRLQTAQSQYGAPSSFA